MQKNRIEVMMKMMRQRVSEAHRRIQRKATSSKGIILMYHRVAKVPVDPWSLCVTPRHFAEQIRIISERFSPIRLQELVAVQATKQIPRRSVAVTFDDGYADNLHEARAVLDAFRVPATVFVCSDYLGQRDGFWWDVLADVLLRPGRLPSELSLEIGDNTLDWDLGTAASYSIEDYENDHLMSAEECRPGTRMNFYKVVWKKLLTCSRSQRHKALKDLEDWSRTPSYDSTHARALSPDEVICLAKSELLEIGAHTVTHPLLSTQVRAEQRYEIDKSKADLEKLIDEPIGSFAYPFGDHTAETVELLKESGFNCACTTMEELVWRRNQPFSLPRYAVRDWHGEEFLRRLERWFVD